MAILSKNLSYAAVIEAKYKILLVNKKPTDKIVLINLILITTIISEKVHWRSTGVFA